MTTWVLILVLNGKALAVVPGYTSMESCKATADRVNRLVSYTSGFCVPGPSIDNPYEVDDQLIQHGITDLR